MFHRKHTVKESQAVSKSDCKRLKSDIKVLFGERHEDLLERIWGKNHAVFKRRWQFGPGASAVIYFFNEIPFFVFVDSFPEDSAGLLFNKANATRCFPTLFLLLLVRLVLWNDSAKLNAFLQDMGASVYCHGPTSRFLMGGAQLMVPGIVSTGIDRQLVARGSLALIYSVGTTIPYAVGFATDNFSTGASAGVGVYVVHSLADTLWKEFHLHFVTKCKVHFSELDCIPRVFGECEVVADVQTIHLVPSPSETVDHSTVTTPASGCLGCSEENGLQTAESEITFEDEDALLDFCLCEAVKTITSKMIPMPVTLFTSKFLSCYPRGTIAGDVHIEFKSTRYKKAMSYFLQRSDVVVIQESSKGVHHISQVNRSSQLVRDHNRKYAGFLEQKHNPALQKEASDVEAQLIRDNPKRVFDQEIVSVDTFYRPMRHITADLIRVVALGSVTAGITAEIWPSLEEVGKPMAPTQEHLCEAAISPDVYKDTLLGKQIKDNINKYIRANNLMIVDSKNKANLPMIKMHGVLGQLAPNICAETLPLDEVMKLVFKYFSVVHEIIIQVSVPGSPSTTFSIPQRRLVKSGSLPQISIWTEKRSGNKTITIVKNMGAFGLNLHMLSQAWKERFHVSSFVVDPAQDMHNLKSGTKIPLEIHLQGNLVREVSEVCREDLGIPIHLITEKAAKKSS